MALKSTDLLVVQDPDDKKFYKTTLASLSGVSQIDTTLPIENVGTSSAPDIAPWRSRAQPAHAWSVPPVPSACACAASNASAA